MSGIRSNTLSGPKIQDPEPDRDKHICLVAFHDLVVDVPQRLGRAVPALDAVLDQDL